MIWLGILSIHRETHRTDGKLNHASIDIASANAGIASVRHRSRLFCKAIESDLSLERLPWPGIGVPQRCMRTCTPRLQRFPTAQRLQTVVFRHVYVWLDRAAACDTHSQTDLADVARRRACTSAATLRREGSLDAPVPAAACSDGSIWVEGVLKQEARSMHEDPTTRQCKP